MPLHLKRLRPILPALIALPIVIGIILPLALLGRHATAPAPSRADTTYCTLQLRSWIVAAQGRHLYLDCDCPPPFDNLSGRVEFTAASLRTDYDRAAAAALLADNPGWAPRIARMSRNAHLAPPSFVTDPDDRLEQTYRVPASAVEILQKDRLFAAPYRLLGPNSNSSLRAVMEDAGIPIPARILSSGGILGEFPGIAQSPGPVLPPDQWANAALPHGPTPIPLPAK